MQPSPRPYVPPKLPNTLTYNDLNGIEAEEILVQWFRQLLCRHPQFQPHLTLPMCRMSLDVKVTVEMFVGGTVPVESPPETFEIGGHAVLNNEWSGRDTSVHNAKPSDFSNPVTYEPLTAVVNASPTPGGSVPDAIRQQHDMPIPAPGYGDRTIGGHLFMGDVVSATEHRMSPDSNRGEARQPQGWVADLEYKPSTHDAATQARQGTVADGYVFAADVETKSPTSQRIAIDRGAVDIDLSGQGDLHQGSQHFSAGSHIASKDKFGDQKGTSYGSVTGTYDPGPAGLARPSGGNRSRLEFGNARGRD